ncbi:MAG: hypothetical protein ACREL7_19045 [Longimicrobiales bacterium]
MTAAAFLAAGLFAAFFAFAVDFFGTGFFLPAGFAGLLVLLFFLELVVAVFDLAFAAMFHLLGCQTLRYMNPNGFPADDRALPHASDIAALSGNR